jgi:L-ascorbate metabolism protein UlaG (beta-lactamase superfamily)
MQIKWLGHSSFLITSKENIKIITDPYIVDGGIKYGPINESANIVTASHNHGDHSNTGIIKGTPRILKEAGSDSVKGIEVKTVSVFHDEAKGGQRGSNLIFCFKVDGLDLCHLGDLGHKLSGPQLSQIGPVDVLFIPVGGFFTVDAKGATEIVEAVKPKLIFPMHYKNSKVEYPIAGVDEFLKGKKNVRKLYTSAIETTKETLPEETEIVVLQSEY